MATQDTLNKAYALGIHAAYRTDEYEGATDVPENPYDEGSETYDKFQEGFSDGTEDFIDSQNNDW